MAAIVTSKEVETTVRSVLGNEGYKTSLERTHGETGTDIIAQRGNELLHIEAISFKSSPPSRAKDFYEVFFRAISRIEVGATACIIAVPSRFGMGLHQRAKKIGIAWGRLGYAFPEVQIWLIDVTEGSLKKTTWNSWSEQP